MTGNVMPTISARAAEPSPPGVAAAPDGQSQIASTEPPAGGHTMMRGPGRLITHASNARSSGTSMTAPLVNFSRNVRSGPIVADNTVPG